MNIPEIRKNMGIAFLSQGMSFFTMACASFLIPKFLGVSEFGYWQLFLLYAGYVGLAHFGLNDGIYLRCGGASREKIDKGLVKGQFLVEASWQVVLSVFICIFTMNNVVDSSRNFVFIAVSIIMILSNLTNFMGYVFQAMNETKLYSYSVIVNRCSYFGLILVLFIFNVDNFELFVAAYLLAQTIAFAYAIKHFGDFLKSKTNKLAVVIKGTFSDIHAGAKLMLANFASTFILGAARFAIEGNWGIDTFSIMSFSITLATFFLSFINQASMVLFPTLRKEDDQDLRVAYCKIKNLLDLILPAIYLLYFPISCFVEWWLPGYRSAILILPYILPICVFDSKMSLLSTTFFKVVREETTLLQVNVLACIVSIAGSLASIFIFDSPMAALISAVVAIIIRSILSEVHFSTRFGIPAIRSIAYDLLMMGVFLAIVSIFDLKTAALLIVPLYLVFILANKRHRAIIFRFIKSKHLARQRRHY